MKYDGGRSLKKLIIVTASGAHASEVDIETMQSVSLGRLFDFEKVCHCALTRLQW